jgi:ABC-type multidrug transport system ATPase subunit
LWEVVKTNKEGRAIILTTHSMEEAEILCDRLGIFVNGQLVCIGSPKEITSRYAGEPAVQTHIHLIQSHPPACNISVPAVTG